MAELEAAVLELGQRPVLRLGRIALRGVRERRFGVEHLQHLLRVRLPVGGAMDVAAGLQARGKQCHQRRLDQPALVVALLVPGIGEEDMHAGQAGGRHHVFQHFDGVVLHDADVGELLVLDPLDESADPRVVHFAAEEVGAGQGRRDLRRRLAHAEADLHYGGRLPSEHGREIELLVPERQDHAGAVFGERAGLSGRDPPGAQHEAADASRVRDGPGCGSGSGSGSGAGFSHRRDCRSRATGAARRGARRRPSRHAPRVRARRPPG